MEISSRVSLVRPPLIRGPNAQQCPPDQSIRFERSPDTFEKPTVLTREGRTDRTLERLRKKVSSGEALTDDERARLEQIKGTTEWKGGELKVSGYVAHKTTNGVTTRTQRAEYGYSTRDGFQARRTDTTGVEKKLEVGGIGIKVESSLKNKSDPGSSTSHKVRIQGPLGFGQLEINQKGQTTVSGGVEVSTKTKTGSAAAGLQVDATLPKGNAPQRDLASRILDRDAQNAQRRRRGYTTEELGRRPEISS